MHAIFVLFVATIIATTEATSCTPTQKQATVLQYVVPNPTGTITLDDLGYSKAREYDANPQTITVGSQQITFSGISCTAASDQLSMGPGTVWNGADPWLGGSEAGKPGYFFNGVSDGSLPMYESTCVITFSPPISEMWFRYNRASDVLAVANIYDSSDELITCTELDTRVNFGATNYYWGYGWRATSRQIKKLEINGGYFGVDNIDWRTGCGDGNAWNGSACYDFDECLLGQCNIHASCLSVNNDVQCTCNAGWSGNGLGPNGCTDNNECSLTPNGGCPSPSVCGNTEGSFYCYCPEGYTGNQGSPAEVSCQNIDECSLPVNLGYPCVDIATGCVDSDPGYTCLCPSGYTGDGRINGQGCSLIDMCQSNPCSPDASCMSVGGVSFTCTCNEGFTGTGIGPNGCDPVGQPGAPLANGPSSTPVDGNSPTSDNGPVGENSPAGQNGPNGVAPNSGPSANSPKSNLVSSGCAVSIGLVALISVFVC